MIYFLTLCRFARVFHNNVPSNSNSSLSKFLINSRIYLQLFYSNIYIYIVSTNEIIQSDIYVISLLCFIIIILNIIILFHHYLRHTRRDKKTFFFFEHHNFQICFSENYIRTTYGTIYNYLLSNFYSHVCIINPGTRYNSQRGIILQRRASITSSGHVKLHTVPVCQRNKPSTYSSRNVH